MVVVVDIEPVAETVAGEYRKLQTGRQRKRGIRTQERTKERKNELNNINDYRHSNIKIMF